MNSSPVPSEDEIIAKRLEFIEIVPFEQESRIFFVRSNIVY